MDQQSKAFNVILRVREKDGLLLQDKRFSTAPWNKRYWQDVRKIGNTLVLLGQPKGYPPGPTVKNGVLSLDLSLNQLWARELVGGDLHDIVPLPGGMAILHTVADAKYVMQQAYIHRYDIFGNIDCSASGTCADKPLGGCDDANPCTSDSCKSSKCAYKNLPDGSACGVAKTCKSGLCQ